MSLSEAGSETESVIPDEEARGGLITLVKGSHLLLTVGTRRNRSAGEGLHAFRCHGKTLLHSRSSRGQAGRSCGSSSSYSSCSKRSQGVFPCRGITQLLSSTRSLWYWWWLWRYFDDHSHHYHHNDGGHSTSQGHCDNDDDYDDDYDHHSHHKGRMGTPKWMKLRKSSKRPLTPPLIFGKSCCGFCDKIATKVRMFIMADCCVLYDPISHEMHVVQQFNVVFGWKQTLKNPFMSFSCWKSPI